MFGKSQGKVGESRLVGKIATLKNKIG